MSADAHDSVFETAFDAAEKHELLGEDDEAWGGVTTLLITIVTGGVLLGALGVFLATTLT